MSSSIWDHKYLSKEQLNGFDRYKYSCIDNSPISVYISHPFWNWIVNFYPRWIAPNVLTLAGWALVMGCFLIESAIDYGLYRNSVDSTNPIGNDFWLLCSVCTFLAHTLDGTDGKQARRIGASGPTGELCALTCPIMGEFFDHGLDSWSTVPFTITIFSVFGRGEFSVSPVRLLGVLISVQLVFIVTHWEKYNTGVLFLSWGYDASQYGLTAFYFLTWFVHHEWYRWYVLPRITFAMIFEAGFYLCCAGSLLMSLYNLHQAYVINKTGKQPSLYEGVRPMLGPVWLFVVSLVWATWSPSDVIDRDPRVFFFAMGTVFSNIACRLIIAQMSLARAEVYNGLLALYSLVALAAFWLPPAAELLLLRVSCVLITLAHVHYGVCVVRQLCAHFRIHAFDVSYLNSSGGANGGSSGGPRRSNSLILKAKK